MTTPRIVYQDDSTTLICGRWQDALAAGMVPRVDAVLGDPPFGARTHSGQRHGRLDPSYSEPWKMAVSNRGIGYDPISADDARDWAAALSDICAGWVGLLTSHDLIAPITEGMEAQGRYVFAPISCTQMYRNVRLAGDGPASWTDHFVVSRPRTLKGWGALPGAYVGSNHDEGENTFDRSKRITGGKPVWLMRAIVSDYSREGDLVLDPCCGSGTTAIAARDMGRRCITIEMDPATCEIARKRIVKHAAQPPLFRPDGLRDATQEPLL